ARGLQQCHPTSSFGAVWCAKTRPATRSVIGDSQAETALTAETPRGLPRGVDISRSIIASSSAWPGSEKERRWIMDATCRWSTASSASGSSRCPGFRSVRAVELGGRIDRMVPPILNHAVEHRGATPAAADAHGGRTCFLFRRGIEDINRVALGDRL